MSTKVVAVAEPDTMSVSISYSSADETVVFLAHAHGIIMATEEDGGAPRLVGGRRLHNWGS